MIAAVTISGQMWSSIVEQIGWVLLHSLWQFALVALLTVTARQAMGRRSASSRYVMLIGAIALMIVSPVATWMCLPSEVPGDLTVRGTSSVEQEQDSHDAMGTVANASPLASDSMLVVDSVFPDRAADVAPAGIMSERSSETRLHFADNATMTLSWWERTEAMLRPWLAWIVVGWGLGVAVCSLRPLLGWHTLSRLKRVGVSPVEDNVQSVMRSISQRLGVRRMVRVLQSRLAQVPVVVGYLRPVILLPVSLATALPAEQLEAILAHELAHVRRHDFLVNLLQTLLETFFFYHPTVWWLSHQIRIEREHCCDDLVVASLGNRMEYSRALLAIEELRGQSSVLALGINDGSLLSRVTRILGSQADVDASRLSDRWPATLLAMATVVIAGVALTNLFAHPTAKDQRDDAAEIAKADSATLESGTGMTVIPIGEWPMWGGSSHRNHVASGPLPVDFDVAAGKNVRWKAKLGTATYASPAVSGGKVFIGTNNGNGLDPRRPREQDYSCLVCFDEATGKLLWQYASEKMAAGRVHDWPAIGLCSTACVLGDRVWFVTNRCEVLCLDANGFRDGENDGPVADEADRTEIDADVVWKFDLFKVLGVRPLHQAVSSVTVVEGVVLLNTSNGPDESHRNIPAPNAPNFLALNATTGEVVWQDNSAGESIIVGGSSCSCSGTSPAVATIGGVTQAIFAGREGWLYGFDFADLKRGQTTLLWRFDCNPKTSQYALGTASGRNTLVASPVVVGDRVYMATGRNPEQGEGPGDLWCIDATKRGDLSSELVFNKSYRNADVPIAHKTLCACDPAAGDFTRPNPNSGVVWHYSGIDRNRDGKLAFDESFHRSISSPTIHGGLLFIPDFSGLLHCVDARTGEGLWTHDVLSPCWSSCVIADGHVLIGDEDGDLEIFKVTRTKQPLHRESPINVDNSVYATPALVSGTLFLATKSDLFAICDPQRVAGKTTNAQAAAYTPFDCEVVDAVTGKPIGEAEFTISFWFKRPAENGTPAEAVGNIHWAPNAKNKFQFRIPDSVLQHPDRDKVVIEWAIQHPKYETLLSKEPVPLSAILADEPKEARNTFRTIEMRLKKGFEPVFGEWGPTINGLRSRLRPVSAATQDDAIDRGQRVTPFRHADDVAFIVEIENVGDKPIKLPDARDGNGNTDWNGQFLYSIDLFDQNGKPIERPVVQVVDVGRVLHNTGTVTLEPGQMHRALLRPAKWLSPFQQRIAPGRYRAAVRYHGLRPIVTEVAGDIATSTVPFEVSAPPVPAVNPFDPEPAPTKRSELVWGNPTNGLRAAMSFAPQRATYAHGEKPDTKLHIQNVSEAPITLTSLLWLSELKATVKNDKGEPVEVGSIWYTGLTLMARVTLKPQQVVIFDAGNVGLAITKERADKFEHITHRKLVAPAGKYVTQLEGRFGNSVRLEDGKGNVLAPLPGDYVGELKTGATPLTITNEIIECDIVDAVTGKPITETTTSFRFIKPKSGDVEETTVAHVIWGPKSPSRIYFTIPDEVMQRTDREELEVQWGTGNHPDYENLSPAERIPLKQFFKEGTTAARESLSKIKLTPKKKAGNAKTEPTAELPKTDVPTQLENGRETAPPLGLEFLTSYPKLHGLSLDMTELQFLEIVKQQELKTRKTVEGEKVTHHIALGDDHTLIVMFDNDAKCSGIQRVRGEDEAPQPLVAKIAGGPTVELLGIGTHQISPETWWAANGRRWNERPHDPNARQVQFALANFGEAQAECRELLMRVTNLPAGESYLAYQWQIDGFMDWAHRGVVREPTEFSAGFFPRLNRKMPAPKSMTLRVGIGELPDDFVRILNADGEKVGEPLTTEELRLIDALVQPVRVEEVNGNVELIMKPTDRAAAPIVVDYVPVAVDKSGKKHERSAPRQRPGLIAYLYPISKQQLDHFECRFHRYRHQITFENVSLLAGHETDVKVIVDRPLNPVAGSGNPRRAHDKSGGPPELRTMREPAFRLPGHSNITGIGFDNNSTELVAVSTYHAATIRRWDLIGMKLKSDVMLSSDRHLRPFREGSFKLSGDGRRVVAATDEYVGIWNTSTGELLKKLPFQTKSGIYDCAVDKLDCTSDLSVIAGDWTMPGRLTLAYDAHVMIWDGNSGKLVQTVIHKNGTDLKSIDLSSDGKLLATTNGGGAKVWETSSGTLLRSFPNDNSGRKHPDPEVSNDATRNVWCVQLSPDGKQIATGDMLGVKLFDVASGELLQQLEGPHRYGLGSLVFSKDGRLLARTGTGDRAEGNKTSYVVPIWSTQTGEKLFELHTESGAGAFSDDNKQFAVGVSDWELALAVFQLSGSAANTTQLAPESTQDKVGAGTHYRGKEAEVFIDTWKPVWGEPRLGIQYGIALTKPQRPFRIGERVPLVVFFRNASDKPLKLDTRPDFFGNTPKVVDANGVTVRFENIPLLGSTPHYVETLEPGEAVGPLYLNFGLGENPRPGQQTWNPYWKTPVAGKYKLTHSVAIKVAGPKAKPDAANSEWKSGDLASGTIEFAIADGVKTATNAPMATNTDVAAKELEPFQGTWAMDLCDSELNGFGDSQDVVKNWRWAINGNEIIWSRSNDEVWKLTLAVDPTKSPKEIDLTFLDGPHKGEKCLGMYEWGGVNKKMLLMSMQDPGAKVERPKSISMQGGGQTSLIFLQPMDAEKELASLQGTWKFEIIQTDGWPKPTGKGPDRLGRGDERQWVIKGNEITWISPDGEEVKLSFTIDPTTSPKHIDVTFINGPHKGQKCLGMYERGGLGGIVLWLCLSDPGSKAPRPTNVSYAFQEGRTMIGLIQVDPD